MSASLSGAQLARLEALASGLPASKRSAFIATTLSYYEWQRGADDGFEKSISLAMRYVSQPQAWTHL
jgi:hypothetical protein